MKLTTLIFLNLCLFLLHGCDSGKRLSGLYVGFPSSQKIQIPGADPSMQQQMNSMMDGLKDLHKMTLDFRGDKVRIGMSGVIHEGKYQIQNNRLEVIFESGGHKTILPMELRSDGTIAYQTYVFTKR